MSGRHLVPGLTHTRWIQGSAPSSRLLMQNPSIYQARGTGQGLTLGNDQMRSYDCRRGRLSVFNRHLEFSGEGRIGSWVLTGNANVQSRTQSVALLLIDRRGQLADVGVFR